MDETNETKKLTLSSIVRWIMGIFFALMFVGLLIQSSIIGAILMLLATIITLPLTAKAIEKAMNFSLSGALRFVVVLILFAGAVATSPQADTHTDASQENIASPSTPSSTEKTTANQPEDNTDVCYYDWTYSMRSSIDYSTAPSGYKYAVVTIYLKNNADSTISTNPWNWNLIADGIKYNHDTTSYGPSINTQALEVRKGGETETKMVFLVKGIPNTAELEYTGFGPDLVRIKYY